MPKGIRTVSVTPNDLRLASVRGDLWMARYFLLEKALADMHLDYSFVRKMSKQDTYSVIDGEKLVLPSTIK